MTDCEAAGGRVYAAIMDAGEDGAFDVSTRLVSHDAADGAAVWDCDVNASLPAASARTTLEYYFQNKFGEHSWHEFGSSDRDIVGVPIVTSDNQRVVSQTRRFLFGVDVKTGKMVWSVPCLRLDETLISPSATTSSSQAPTTACCWRCARWTERRCGPWT